jgi:putative membrane protein
MMRQLALLGALALVAGCAHRTSENRVVVSDSSSPYASDSYGRSYSDDSGYYGTYAPTEYDNTSKGAGARAMMFNPYADNTYPYNRTYRTSSTYYGAPAGAAVDTETETTSKGAGARTLKGETRETEVVAGSPVTTTTTTATESDNTSKGQGARALTGATETSVRSDADFVREAAQAGLAEVKMGELAQQNAQNQQFKDFGQRLVTDHQKANDELSRIATQKGLQVPTAMSQRDQGMLDRLSSMNGAEFDRACSHHAVEAHQKAIRLFETEAQSGQDTDLKAFAQNTLPTLREHLRMARDLNKGD